MPTEAESSTPSPMLQTATFEMVENDVWARANEADDYIQASIAQVQPMAGQARTGDESYARLDYLPGNTILRLGPITEFTMSELADSPQGDFSRLQLETGKLWIVLLEGDWELETTRGTAAVHGSKMDVYYPIDSQ